MNRSGQTLGPDTRWAAEWVFCILSYSLLNWHGFGMSRVCLLNCFLNPLWTRVWLLPNNCQFSRIHIDCSSVNALSSRRFFARRSYSCSGFFSRDTEEGGREGVGAGSARRPADEDVAAVALVHDLAVDADLADVGAVLEEVPGREASSINSPRLDAARCSFSLATLASMRLTRRA